MHFLRMGRRRLAWLVISIGFVALVGVAPVEAQPGLQDCIYTNYQAQGCIAPVAVPEPSTLLLLITGVAGVGLRYRRKLK